MEAALTEDEVSFRIALSTAYLFCAEKNERGAVPPLWRKPPRFSPALPGGSVPLGPRHWHLLAIGHSTAQKM